MDGIRNRNLSHEAESSRKSIEESIDEIAFQAQWPAYQSYPCSTQ
jgi:hypothetical protein